MAENTGLYLTAMVGIVAVVAVVILTMNAGGGVALLAGDGSAGDLTGQAFSKVKIAPTVKIVPAQVRQGQVAGLQSTDSEGPYGSTQGVAANRLWMPNGFTQMTPAQKANVRKIQNVLQNLNTNEIQQFQGMSGPEIEGYMSQNFDVYINVQQGSPTCGGNGCAFFVFVGCICN